MNYYDTINLLELIEGSLVSMGLASNVANANMLKYINSKLSNRLGGSAFLKDEIEVIITNKKDNTLYTFKTFYVPRESRVLVTKNDNKFTVSMDLDGEHFIIETNNEDLLTIDQTNEFKYDKINVSFENNFLDYITLRTLDMDDNKEIASSIHPLYVKDNERVYLAYSSELDDNVVSRDKLLSIPLENNSNKIVDYVPNIIGKQRDEMQKEIKEIKNRNLHR